MEVADWIKNVGAQRSIDTSPAIELFEKHAITMKIVPQLTQAEWKELIPQVGLRTALRTAAEDVDVAESEDISEQVSRARNEKERLQKHEENLRQMNDITSESINKCESDLNTKTAELVDASRERDEIVRKSSSINTEKEMISMQIDHAKMEKAQKLAEKEKLASERDAALVQARALSSYAGNMSM